VDATSVGGTGSRKAKNKYLGVRDDDLSIYGVGNLRLGLRWRDRINEFCRAFPYIVLMSTDSYKPSVENELLEAKLRLLQYGVEYFRACFTRRPISRICSVVSTSRSGVFIQSKEVKRSRVIKVVGM
jgi:hypothetical protein